MANDSPGEQQQTTAAATAGSRLKNTLLLNIASVGAPVVSEQVFNSLTTVIGEEAVKSITKLYQLGGTKTWAIQFHDSFKHQELEGVSIPF